MVRTTSPLIRRARMPKLGGAVKVNDLSTWQVMIRAAQTRAFGKVAVVGVLMTGLFGITVPHVVHTTAQDREQGPVAGAVVHILESEPESGARSTTSAELGSSGDPASRHYGGNVATFETLAPRETTATDYAERDAEPTGNYLDLEKALAELEQDEARREAWAAQNGVPPLPSCGSVCTAPGPGRLPPGLIPPWDPANVDHLPSQVAMQTPQEHLNPPPAVAPVEQSENQVETLVPGASSPTATAQSPPPDGPAPAPPGDAQGPVPGPVG